MGRADQIAVSDPGRRGAHIPDGLPYDAGRTFRENEVRASNRGCNNAFAAFVLAGFVAFGSPVRAAGISDGVVKIGVVNDATGPLSDSNGQGSVVAARMAIDDFRKQNPNIKVELLFADHQYKPVIGVAVVRKLFDVDVVDVIADVGISAVGLALHTVIRDKNKIAIYTSVATTELTGKQCVKTSFAWLHDSYTLVAGPLRSLSVAEGLDTWFFVAADYAFGKNMVAESQRVLARVGGKSLPAPSTIRWTPQTTARCSCCKLRARAPRWWRFSSVGSQPRQLHEAVEEFGMDAVEHAAAG